MGPRITSKNVDLSNCDREEIQFPASILPHGVMLILREPDFTIVQASQNSGTWFGIAADQLVGRGLGELFDADPLQTVVGKLEGIPLSAPPLRVADVRINEIEWDVLAHRHDQVLFLEFESRSEQNPTSVIDLYSEVRPAIAKLQNAPSIQEFLNIAVQQIRTFTGFDRVMAYKFLADGSGKVCAESVISGQTSYLGQHFPPTDIPAPARRLFSISWVRHQPDIGYVPVPMVPEDNPVTGRRLDMSHAVLRSVSPMYIGYLKNMGTRSSMVMTLLKDGRPWGLIACHHHTGPKHVPYEVRTACEFLANMISLLISEKEDLEFADYKLALKETQSQLIELMTRNEKFTAALTEGKPNLLDFVDAGGAAVISDHKISLLGATPSEEQVRDLVEWMSTHVRDEVFATDFLTSIFPAAEEFRNVASGVLAMRFAATKKDYVLWFRPEVIQTVKWAGDPNKPVDYSNDGATLMPRASFALWIQTVNLKSKPWLKLEIEAAREFRIAILEIIMKQAERLGELYKSLEQSHVELDAFAVAANAKFRAIFEQTPVFAGVMDVDGTLININRVWLEMCGYREEDVIGKPFWETGWWQGSEDMKATIRTVTHQAAQGIPYEGALNYYWSDGTERLVDFAMHAIRDDQGKIIFLHPTGVDITDLKRVEAELHKSREHLERRVAERTEELSLSLVEVESEITVRKQTEEQLRDLSAQVLRLQDEERRRIARDLHDSTGQTLSALKMVLGQLGRLLVNVPKTPELLQDLNQLADQSLQEIRTISYLLHPPMLDEVGFSSAAQWYVEGLVKRSGVKITMDLAPLPRLTNAAELALFRVMQESLTNVLRHSGSTKAHVHLKSEEEVAVLSIRDFGKGIPRDKVQRFNQTGTGGGVGLSGMRQRLRDFGGQLSIQSDDTGTVISATLPFAKFLWSEDLPPNASSKEASASG